jgi:N-sulfoglucosamine sulfohydrolase
VCFQGILNRTRNKENLYWFKTLKEYYNRPEWELYDLKHDPEELNNLAGKNDYKIIMKELELRLFQWQNVTSDPWICSPHAVLENKGNYRNNPQCMPLENM